MDVRQLAGVGILAAGAWWALRLRPDWRPDVWLSELLHAASGRQGPQTGNLPATTLPGTPQNPPAGSLGPIGYVATVIARESGGDVQAKNPRSSASGKYQFTRATWLRLGGSWGPDPARPFGGLVVSEAEQDRRFADFTKGNAAGLARGGIQASSGALYAAHFLGLTGALQVLASPPSTKLANVVGSKVMAANPQLAGFTVGDFKAWLNRR